MQEPGKILCYNGYVVHDPEKMRFFCGDTGAKNLVLSRIKFLPIIGRDGKLTGRDRVVRDVVSRGPYVVYCPQGTTAEYKNRENRFHESTRFLLQQQGPTVTQVYCHGYIGPPIEVEGTSVCASTSTHAAASISATIRPITGFVDLRRADQRVAVHYAVGQITMRYRSIDVQTARSDSFVNSYSWPTTTIPDEQMLVCMELQTPNEQPVEMEIIARTTDAGLE